MKNLFIKISILLIVVFFSACELYPDWNDYVEYADTYPVSGEYLVRDFDINNNTVTEDWYKLYIYNKADNTTKDSVWIDNSSGHPAGGTSTYSFKYKIKTAADMENLSFNCVKAGNVTGLNVNPLDSAITITITNSKVFDMSSDITDSTPDSIYFEFVYYDKFGTQIGSFITAGHRKTGWEYPQDDDDM